MVKSMLRWLSPAGARGRLSVLIFHRVLPARDPLFPDEIDAARFERLCAWLAQHFNVLPLDAAVTALRTGHLPERALAITFDDGYADNHDVALPILRRHGLNATFFVATGFMDGGIMWNDAVIEGVRRTSCETLDLQALDLGRHELRDVASRRAAIDALIGRLKYLPPAQRALQAVNVAAHAGVALPRDLMMSSEQLRQLRRGGMQIGAHTVSHPILRTLDPMAMREEMVQSKRHLESLLQEPVQLFAYPNGKWGVDFDAQAAHLARELGFRAAVSTDWGSANARTDPFRIPRFTPWDRSPLRFGLRMAANLRRDGAVLGTPA